jgi:hypothetical protein
MPEEVGAWTEGVLLAEVMTIPEEPTALQPLECGPMNPEGAGHVVRFDPERRAVGGQVASPVTEATQLPFEPRARRWMSLL